MKADSHGSVNNNRSALIDVALGNLPADLVIRDGRLINVNTAETIDGTDVAVKGDRIALVGDARHCIGKDTIVLEANGQWLMPGLIDSHFHIESTMLTASELARVLVPRGVTTVMQDPHEIGNVLGVPGIELFQTEAEGLPFRVYLRVPGRIPAVPPESETNGASVSFEETKRLLNRADAVALAGDVNAYLVLGKDAGHLEKIAYTLGLNKTIAGQAHLQDEMKLNAFIAGGPQDCHVSYTPENVLAKIRRGMRAILCYRPRRRMSKEDLRELAVLVNQNNVDLRLCLLCIDDKQTSHLVREGGLDYLVRLAIEVGFDPVRTIQMATINAADHFKITKDLGSISPGKLADIVMLSRLEDIRVDRVIVGGKPVAENGRLTEPLPEFEYPDWSRNTIHIRDTIRPEDLALKTTSDQSHVDTRVIVTEIPKKIVVRRLQSSNGVVQASPEDDILPIAVVERHKATGNIGKAFITGTGIKQGAFASSVAHDAHNIVVVGKSLSDMAMCVNTLAEIGGGLVAVNDGKVLGQVALPIAGLISLKPADVVAEDFGKLEQIVLNELGCELSPNPFFQLAMISLPNVPNVGLTDKGLFDVIQYQIINNFVE